MAASGAVVAHVCQMHCTATLGVPMLSRNDTRLHGARWRRHRRRELRRRSDGWSYHHARGSARSEPPNTRPTDVFHRVRHRPLRIGGAAARAAPIGASTARCRACIRERRQSLRHDAGACQHWGIMSGDLPPTSHTDPTACVPQSPSYIQSQPHVARAAPSPRLRPDARAAT